jgi:hypothetical protein
MNQIIKTLAIIWLIFVALVGMTFIGFIIFQCNIATIIALGISCLLAMIILIISFLTKKAIDFLFPIFVAVEKRGPRQR